MSAIVVIEADKLMRELLVEWLNAAGFTEVRVTLKPESREMIATWAPGLGIEDYVLSAAVEARKPPNQP